MAVTIRDGTRDFAEVGRCSRCLKSDTKTEAMKPAFAFLILLTCLSRTHADELMESYTARLSANDHFSSKGERLESAAAIIRQDRANYHKFNLRDPEDGEDVFFASAGNRALLEKQLERGTSERSALRAVVNGTPLVKVLIFRSDRTGQDYVVVRVVSE